MVYIYSETFRPWAKLKRQIKNLIGRSLGGPKAVELSLLLGLKEAGVDFVWNKKPVGLGHVACVLSGSDTFKWAIKQKQKGIFKKVIAGPTVVITPFDHHNLIQDSSMDLFVVPSQWCIDWWVSLVPSLKAKLAVWAAGVKDSGELVNKTGTVLIYQKNAPPEIFDFVKKQLQSSGQSYQTIFYGRFKQSDYFRLLAQSRYMIYLSQSESQGLALHEAWMAGLPTLVWNRGYLQYKTWQWHDNTIAAPYLTSACGRFFSGTKDFPSVFQEFNDQINTFNSRAYSLENFSNRVTAEKYLSIIKSL